MHCMLWPYYFGYERGGNVKTDFMSARERFHAVMNFQPFDRLPVVEWAMWWDKTIDRWHTEGLPAGITDRYDLYRHFDEDIYKQNWIGSRKEGCPNAPAHGMGIISSDKDYEKVRPFLFPSPAEMGERVKQWRSFADDQKRGDCVTWITIEGFFWFPRTLFGIEPHLYAFYDHPELMHRINSDLADWILRVFDALCSIVTPDFMTFAEDMSYNHGPMLSKELFDEFMKPYYMKIIPRLKERGILTIVDSDGDVTAPAFWFEEAGLDGILPLERQAGVDIGRLRREHPGMRFVGHFDKMTMDKGEARMRAEFERLLPTASRGGFLVSVDHQTPPGVSYRDYQLYLALFREYAVEAGRLSRQVIDNGKKKI